MEYELKGNSNKAKDEPEEQVSRVEAPVVKGNVKVKKESLGKKFSETFLADSAGNVGSYLLYDVLIPAVKNLFVDLVNNGTEMLVNGRSRASRGHSGGSGRVSYSKYYKESEKDDRRDYSRPKNRERYSYNDIVFDNSGDAREVLDCMNDILEKFKLVSIADFYELCKAEECERYTDRDYGWFDLSDAHISRDRDGYKISLPRPEYLK